MTVVETEMASPALFGTLRVRFGLEIYKLASRLVLGLGSGLDIDVLRCRFVRVGLGLGLY